MTTEPPGTTEELDFRGSRRLTGVEEWAWYAIAAVTYIAAGIWQRWLLNWIIGPVWLVAIVCVGPALLDRLRSRGGRRSAGRNTLQPGGSQDPPR